VIRGTVAPQPDWCRGTLAQAVYGAALVAAERCEAFIWWDGDVASLAAHMAMLAQVYVQNRLEEPREKEAKRLVVRAFMADYMLLDHDMVDAPGTIRADGLDADVAALCDVPALQ
jgi:hypothetical protein